jgi:phosphatidylglycerophosphate synthase
MWYIEPIEIIMIFPKSISLVINIIVLSVLARKPKLMLTWAILLGLASWTIYVFLDLVIFIIAANSPEMFTIANVLFDIIFIFSHAFAFCIYYASELIKMDKEELNKRKIIILLSLIIISTLVLSFGTDLVVYDSNRNIIPKENLPFDGPFTLEARNVVIAIPFVFTVLFFFIAAIRTLWKLSRSFEDPIVKLKVQYLLIGSSLIAAGLIWYLIVPTLFPGKGLIPSIGGHLLWLLAPIYILKSQIQMQKAN